MTITHPYIDNITHLTLSANSEQTMHIALTFDNKYAMPAGVTIFSIIRNNSDLSLHFHLIIDNISDENRAKFASLVNDKISISFYEVNRHFKINNNTLTDQFPPISCARFIIPQIVKHITDKILYIDSDILCIDSISSLMYKKLNNCIVAAVIDSIDGVHAYAKEKLFFDNKVYFNSGVLLINIPEWEKNDITSKCINMVNNGLIYQFADQDVLNILLKNNVKFLDKKFNTEIMLSVNNKEDEALTDRAALIHYVSSNKPWYMVYESLFFKKYFSISPWMDYKLPLTNKNSSLRQHASRCFKAGHIIRAIHLYYLYLKTKKSH